MADAKPRVNPESGRPDHLINEEVDRALGRIIINHFVAFAVLLFLMTAVMSFANMPISPVFGVRRFLDTLSVLIIMTPFFLGTNKFFTARLRYGREFVQKKQWSEAVASLEAFNHLGQRFFDRSGEAHYLLSIALAQQGRLTEAEKAREFVLKSRPASTWAERIREAAQNRPRAAKAPAKRVSTGPDQEATRPRTAKGKRRRF